MERGSGDAPQPYVTERRLDALNLNEDFFDRVGELDEKGFDCFIRILAEWSVDGKHKFMRGDVEPRALALVNEVIAEHELSGAGK